MEIIFWLIVAYLILRSFIRRLNREQQKQAKRSAEAEAASMAPRNEAGLPPTANDLHYVAAGKDPGAIELH